MPKDLRKEGVLKKVPLESIDMGERSRKDYGPINTLADSIILHGQFSSITLCEHPNPSNANGYEYLLLAGGRRLKAFRYVQENLDKIPEDVPVETFNTIDAKIFKHELDELEIKFIELSENLDRKEMTYVEKIQIQTEICSLQKAIHGEKNFPQDPNGISNRDIAKMLGRSAGGFADDMKLANAIVQVPDLELDQCENKSEAMKKLRNFERTINTSIKAEKFENKVDKGPALLKTMSRHYIHGDFFVEAADIKSETVDLIEIDPPYAIGLNDEANPAKRGYQSDGYNEVPESEYEIFMDRTISEAYRLLKPHGWMILWFAPEPWAETLFNLIKKHKFKTNRLWGCWAKGGGQTKQFNIRMGNGYELFFYARKGGATLKKFGRSNLFEFKPVSPAKKIHPTERPVPMLVELLTTFVEPGSTVLVPFLGSGNTIRAAYEAKMMAYGYDMNKKYRESYIVRLNEALRDG